MKFKCPTPGQEFKGLQFGVRLIQRGPNDPHVCIQLLAEDDEHWFELGNSFSAYWLDDLIMQLNTAKDALDSLPKSKDGYGHNFFQNISPGEFK